jgi:hypothetical protein
MTMSTMTAKEEEEAMTLLIQAKKDEMVSCMVGFENRVALLLADDGYFVFGIFQIDRARELYKINLVR